MLVDKSLLILVVDDTKKLANTGNKSGKLQRWANHTEQSEMFGKQKTRGLNSVKCPWMHQEQGIKVLSTEPGLYLENKDLE